MNILTISTLYNRGGAAYIAKTIHDEFKKEGYKTKFLVGYGKNGLKEEISDSSLIFSDYSIPITPHVNFITHSLIGKDLFSPKKKQLIELIKWSDVIICHTLHSYFLNFETFFEILKKEGIKKKIIFVAHDSWHYTGRCAVIYDCNNWLNGCVKCPNKNFYPSSKISISETERIKKIKAINNIPNLSFVSPAKWICKDLETTYPKIPVHLIRNGINTQFVKNCKVELKKDKQVELFVSAVDLSQKGKIDLELTRQILDNGFKIHFVGKNNPFKNHTNAITYGYVSDKNKYIEILQKVDCFLFSSSIDTYPTVLIDAICSGAYIFYTKSKGSIEIMESENSWLGTAITSVGDLEKKVKSYEFNNQLCDISLRENKRQEASLFYSERRMLNNYIQVINRIENK